MSENHGGARSGAIFFRQFSILWLAGVVGLLAVSPYLNALAGQTLAETLRAESQKWGVSVATLQALHFVQSVVLLAIMVALGLAAAARVGLHAPVSEAMARRERPHIKHFAKFSFALGVAVGLGLWLADARLFKSIAPPTVPAPSAWAGALASYYGGVNEELQLRLCLLSLLALLLRVVLRKNALTPLVFWLANLLSALLFGAAHLPALGALGALTTPQITRVLVLNGAAGLVFGWAYRRRGLEAAMLAHFAADLVLHVIVPVLSIDL